MPVGLHNSSKSISESMAHRPSPLCRKTLNHHGVVALTVYLLLSLTAHAIDLNCHWSCDDGAAYEIHQDGDRFFLVGTGSSFHNQFNGVIMRALDGFVVLGVRKDIGGRGNHGILGLCIPNATTLQRQCEVGNFGRAVWQKASNCGKATRMD